MRLGWCSWFVWVVWQQASCPRGAPHMGRFCGGVVTETFGGGVVHHLSVSRLPLHSQATVTVTATSPVRKSGSGYHRLNLEP